jgi:hypothetical protein
MNGIKPRVRALITSLYHNPNITVTTAEIRPGATPAEIDTARHYAHGYLPQSVAEFYTQIRYFRLKWEYTGLSLPSTLDPKVDPNLQFGYTQFLN